jgi:hypothetical protein
MQKRTIVAGLGLTAVILAAGTSGAVAGGLITGKDIKDGSVHKVDLSKGVNTALTKAGTPGVQGPQGEPGKDGVDGKDGKDAVNPHVHPAAGAGYAGLGAHAEWAPHSYGETVETCKPGETITGGGYSSWGGFQGDNSKDLGGNNKDVVITVSAPYIANDAAYNPIKDGIDSRFHADRWVVRGYNNSDEPVDVRAWALCAN